MRAGAWPAPWSSIAKLDSEQPRKAHNTMQSSGEVSELVVILPSSFLDHFRLPQWPSARFSWVATTQVRFKVHLSSSKCFRVTCLHS